MKSFSKTGIKILLSLLLTLSLLLEGAGAAFAASTEDEAFERFMYEEWVDSLEADYLTMHYGVKDHQKYGIEKPELIIADVSLESYEEGIKENTRVLEELHAFQYEALSEENKASYDTLEFFLEKSLILYQYPQFDEMFNPYSGMLDNIITNFTEFVFYSAEDVPDYLTLLADMPRLIDDMLELTKYQVEEFGYFMPDSALDEALSMMGDFVSDGDENPLILIFEENLEGVAGIGDAEKAAYKEENRKRVADIFRAYEKAMPILESYRGKRAHEEGLWAFPGGEEYYAALAQFRTSTDDSVEDMFVLLEDTISRVLQYYRSRASSVSQEGRSEVPQTTPEEMFEFFRSHMTEFPEGPDVQYEITYLHPSVAQPSILAYYMNPPIDDITRNVIRINGENMSGSDTDLFLTLSHEGFPGHCYQFTYYFAKDPNPLRTLVSTMGYQEGWAMYVENIMIREAEISPYSQLENEVNTVYAYVFNALFDLGIHGLRWTLDDFAAYMADYGYTRRDCEDIYESTVAMPGSILSYGVGDAMFLMLRAKAETAFAGEFDPVEYHRVLLDNGPVPFETLERLVDNYIMNAGLQVPEGCMPYDIEIQGVPLSPLYAVENSQGSQGSQESQGSQGNQGSGTQEGQDKPQARPGEIELPSGFPSLDSGVAVSMAGVVLGIIVATIVLTIVVSVIMKKKDH